MPSRKKRVEKKIESLEECIREHEEKKTQYEGMAGKQDVVKYWEDEIDEFKRQIYEARGILGRKKKSK